MLKRVVRSAWLGLALSPLCVAQAPAASDPLQSLQFLEGTWTAKGTGQGASASGTYSFVRELRGHVLARHAQSASCKGPADFDCQHGDLLYVYSEGAQPLKALFLDNEGHVIHYDVSTPEPDTAVFLSPAASDGPQFRLTYALKAGVMSGKFQVRMPGQDGWRSYLEWTGTKE